jgi:hypothetical protein
MKCEHCPVPQGTACLVEIWGGIRPHCQWIAEGREDVRLAILNDSTGAARPEPPPTPRTPPRMLGPAYLRCPHRKPLPPELREGCGCSRWCELGRSEKPHGKVDSMDCEACIRSGGWPGYDPETHGTI